MSKKKKKSFVSITKKNLERSVLSVGECVTIRPQRVWSLFVKSSLTCSFNCNTGKKTRKKKGMPPRVGGRKIRPKTKVQLEAQRILHLLESTGTKFNPIDVPKDFTCSICLELWRVPVQLNPCQHIFCQDCCAKALVGKDKKQECPTCRQTVIAKSAPHKILLNMLDEVQFQCSDCHWNPHK